MSHDIDHYDSDEHPVRVYDGPDTAVAFVKADDRITGRCLVRLDQTPMTYGRIYGDKELLEPRLKTLGFERRSDLDGARLRLAEEDGHIVCPYIDGSDRAKERDGFLFIGRGDHDCQRTNGYLESEDRASCDWCEDLCDADDLEVTHNDSYICSGCREGDDWVYAYVRRYDQAWIRDEDAVCLNGDWYLADSEVLYRFGFTWSDYCDEWIHEDDATYCEVVQDYLPHRDTVMDHDGNYIPRDDAVYLDGLARPFHPDDPPDDVECRDGIWYVIKEEEEETA